MASSSSAPGAEPAGSTLGAEWKHTQPATSRVVVQEGPSFWQLAVIDLKVIDYRDSRVDDNQKLYGRKVSAKEILIDGTVRTPRAAQALDSALTKYSPKGGQTFARL